MINFQKTEESFSILEDKVKILVNKYLDACRERDLFLERLIILEEKFNDLVKFSDFENLEMRLEKKENFREDSLNEEIEIEFEEIGSLKEKEV